MQKTTRFNTLVLAPSLLLLLSGAANAADALKYVPADSQMVATLNLRQIIESPLFDRVWVQEFNGPQYQPQIDALKALTGVDVLKDINRVTLSGYVDDDSSVAVVFEGNLAPEKLVPLVQMNGTYQKKTINGMDVHYWMDGEETFATFLPDKSLLITKSEARLQKCVSAANNAAERFSGPAGPDDVAGWAWLSAENGNDGLQELSRQFDVKNIFTQLEVANGKVTCQAEVRTATLQAQEAWVQMAEGLVAAGTLQKSEAMVQEIARRAVINKDAEEKSVALKIEMTDDEFVNAAKQMAGQALNGDGTEGLAFLD